MKTRLYSLIMAAAMTIAFGISGASAQSATQRPDITTDIVVGEVSTQELLTGWIGLRVRLGPGWKMYWKSPGDAGLPPEFDWTGSHNLQAAEVQWPAPHRTSILGVDSIGYTGDVVFPVKISVAEPDDITRISLKLVLYACSTICIREERTLTANLAHPSDANAQGLIDAWRAKVPPQQSASLGIAGFELLGSNPPRLRIAAASATPFAQPDLFIAGGPAIFGDKPQVEISGGHATLTAPLHGDATALASLSSLDVTLVDGDRAVEKTLSIGNPTPARGIAAAPRTTPAGDAPQTLWTVLLTALLGGFILNLMPCVFPVMSLKFLGFVTQPAGERFAVRTGLVASALGVIASFLLLATFMVALKSAGATIGWGLQFQQPVFLAVMTAVIVLFAANLLGLFEMTLPPSLANALARRGVGSTASSHFASGFVATLLATPCSAPFVGTAIGFALPRGGAEIYLVFAALGVGMALPYLVVACIPNLAAFLPRPGGWMLQVKRIMAVALLGTAAWLLTLIDGTAGRLPAALVAVALVGGLTVLWWRALRPEPRAVIVAACMVAAVAIAAEFGAEPARSEAPASAGIPWRSMAELDALIRSGQTVFVDVTADWCVTCKVNEALVIGDDTIRRRLSTDVIPVRADWTRPDPRIAAYLNSFGRYGLPFNIVFSPAAPAGVVLPELLTRHAVLSAFAQSSGGTSRPASQK